jgi:hypothetical protein
MKPRMKQEQLLVLLTDNMREMETELRAHSIVLEALTERVIEPEQIGEALLWARSSTAMLEFIARKYELFEKVFTTGDAPTLISRPLGLADAGPYSH